MPTDFDRHAIKGNEFLHRLSARLSFRSDDHRTMRILRSVLHVLRQRLTLEESMQMISQFPVAVKGVYVDGWKIHHPKLKIRTMREFAAKVASTDIASSKDFYDETQLIESIRAVFQTLREYVSPGELSDVVGVL